MKAPSVKVLGLIAILVSACSVIAQARSEVTDWRPALPSIEQAVGTHEYVFENNRPALSQDTLVQLADHLHVLRARVAKHLLGSLVVLEKHCRDEAGRGGRQAIHALLRCLSIVSAHDRFYERRSSEVGCLQHLVRGELSVDKSDPPQGSAASPYFFLNRRDPLDVYDNVGPFFAEWQEHAGWIRYCLERGHAADGITWVVATEQFESQPPLSLPISTLARSAVLRRRMSSDGTVSCVVTLFEEDGRTSREYRSVWAGTQPKRMEAVDYFAGSAQLNSVRKISVLRSGLEADVPELLDVAVSPVEQYVIVDARGNVHHKVDVRDLGALSTAESVESEEPSRPQPESPSNPERAAPAAAPATEPPTPATSSAEPAIWQQDSLPLVEVVPHRQSLDIGERKPERVTFHISNLTASPLEIVEVKPSCGCAALEVERKTIPAYGASRIDVTISTSDSKVVATTIVCRLGEHTGEVIAKVDCVAAAKQTATEEPR